MKRIIISIFMLVIYCFIFTGCIRHDEPHKSDSIKIGTIYELTGKDSSLGKSSLEGIKLAAKEINEQGGILSKKIELINEDNKSKDDEGIQSARMLIEKENVAAIIGSAISSNVLAEARIAQDAGVPWIAPSAFDIDIKALGDFVYRTCYDDKFQGWLLAEYAGMKIKAEKVAIMRDITCKRTVNIAFAFKEKYKGEIVAEENYGQKDSDFTKQLAAIKEAKPEILFISGYYTEIVEIIIQARAMGIMMPILCFDIWDPSECIYTAGKAADNVYFSEHYTAKDKSRAVQDFIKRFKKEYGHEPDAFAALGYDALKILCYAIEKAGSVEHEAVKKALAEIKYFPSLAGPMDIDKDGNAVKSAMMLKIQDKEIVFLEHISPNVP